MAIERTTDVEAIWADVGASLQAFVRRRVADPHAAEEIVAEVLVKVYQHLDVLDDRERTTAWVFRITRNAIIDHYRRAGRRRDGTSIEAVGDVAGPETADGWIADETAALTELAACVRPLVDGLPDEYRRALELTDLEGRTQAEAARIEGVSLSGMKSRVQRGRRLLGALVRSCCEVTIDRRGGVVGVEPRGAGGCDDGCGCHPA